jgi:ribonuclease HII
MPWAASIQARYTPRRSAGLTGYERALVRAGLGPVAGIDEAGRGACAGPLVVAAVILDPRRVPAGLADSKALAPAVRDAVYRRLVRSALAWHAVVISPADIDELGLHACNVAGMRRALAGLTVAPGYALTDGFPVPGLPVPALAMWQGDEVAACVAAASVIAKVTRDAIMRRLHETYPEYGFTRHKGYSTAEHMAALADHGPCPEHRKSFANVAARPEVAQAAGAAGDMPQAAGAAGDMLEAAGVAGDMLEAAGAAGDMLEAAGAAGDMPQAAGAAGDMLEAAGVAGDMPQVADVAKGSADAAAASGQAGGQSGPLQDDRGPMVDLIEPRLVCRHSA